MNCAVLEPVAVLPEVATGRPMSALSIALWKRVRDEGGWWTASELARVMGEPLDDVRYRLRNLVESRYLAQRINPVTKLRRVGVMPFSRCPAGEVLEPVRFVELAGA